VSDVSDTKKKSEETLKLPTIKAKKVIPTGPLLKMTASLKEIAIFEQEIRVV
jgi:hypothetical protein